MVNNECSVVAKLLPGLGGEPPSRSPTSLIVAALHLLCINPKIFLSD
jgi:hypothetical protein